MPIPDIEKLLRIQKYARVKVENKRLIAEKNKERRSKTLGILLGLKMFEQINIFTDLDQILIDFELKQLNFENVVNYSDNPTLNNLRRELIPFVFFAINIYKNIERVNSSVQIGNSYNVQVKSRYDLQHHLNTCIESNSYGNIRYKGKLRSRPKEGNIDGNQYEPSILNTAIENIKIFYDMRLMEFCAGGNRILSAITGEKFDFDVIAPDFLTDFYSSGSYFASLEPVTVLSFNCYTSTHPLYIQSQNVLLGLSSTDEFLQPLYLHDQNPFIVNGSMPIGEINQKLKEIL